MTTVEKVPATSYQQFMPADRPVQYLAPDGTGVDSAARYARPSDERLLEMYRSMVHGRRFDQQATALTKQGRLAVYPSSRGQEACQIAAALCLGEQDWMFPTYRDSMALAARGVDQVELLGMLAGYWHCGYDPTAYKVAPQCTPLATQLLHATGFAYPAFEQIVSHVAKLRNRTRGSLTAPMVIRIPFAGGIGGVEHHCDSSEAYYAHTPGLKVVSPSTVADAYSLMRDAIADPDPVIFLEPKRLYFSKDDIELTKTEPIGTAVVRRSGTDVTLLAYGPTVSVAMQSAEFAAEDGRSVEVIDLRSLNPFDDETVAASVRKTGRCIVIQEAQGFSGVAAEIASRVSERCFHHLHAPVLRVTGLDIPYPAPKLEHFHLPSADRVLDAMDRLQWNDAPDLSKAVTV